MSVHPFHVTTVTWRDSLWYVINSGFDVEDRRLAIVSTTVELLLSIE